MSAFMLPEITQETFLVVESQSGESTSFPALVALTNGQAIRYEKRKVTETCDPAILAAVKDYSEGTPIKVEFIRDKFWARLSAPGYLDATDWDGPFDSEEEARDTLTDTYDVCSECGEDMDIEGNRCASCAEE